MSNNICPSCKTIYTEEKDKCPNCDETLRKINDFYNDDTFLKEEVPKVMAIRKEIGLEGLVGDLEAIVINVEKENFPHALLDLLSNTGLEIFESYEDNEYFRTVLRKENSADFIFQYRKDTTSNPFKETNINPKSEELPNTRLETLIFTCSNLKKYVEIQNKQGVEFLTDDIVKNENYFFIQTKPSKYTGNSIGLIEWRKKNKSYLSKTGKYRKIEIKKPDFPFLSNIKQLDHCATRVKASERDKAIIEFMKLTNYKFDFSIYVKNLNSITNVARLKKDAYAMVFTSGIKDFEDIDTSGPTEKFIHNYGTRVHHMAFHTENIDNTFNNLKNKGQEFLLELVGSEEEGLKQTFTVPSPYTFLVNEYIFRFGDFDGFFTKSNVFLLTEATNKQ